MSAAGSVPPYSLLARVYDRSPSDALADGVTIKDAVSTLMLESLDAPASPETHLLDLACGTGDITRQLHDMGYSVDGVDSSPEMLQVAGGKVQSPQVRFVCSSMQDYRADAVYAGAICTSYSLTYVRRPDEVRRVFANVRDSLRDGGVFAFDMLTPAGAHAAWGQSPETGTWPDLAFRTDGFRLDEATNDFELRFVFREMATHREQYEMHRGRLHAAEQLLELASDVSFRTSSLVDLEGGGDSGLPLRRFALVVTK